LGSGSWQTRSEENYGYRKQTVRPDKEANRGGNHARAIADQRRSCAVACAKRAGDYECGEEDNDDGKQILLQYQGAHSGGALITSN